MTTKASPALLEDVAWTFATVAAMKSETKLAVGDKVRTQGYLSAGDGGGWFYTIATSGTAVDGYVDHALNNGLKAVLDHGAVFHAEWAGAVRGVEASAQLNAAWVHLRSWKASQSPFPDVRFIHSSTCTLANQVAIQSSTNGRIVGVNVDFSNSYLIAVAGGDLTSSKAMLLVQVRGDVYMGQLDGAKFAAAYDFTGCAGARIFNPAGTRFKGFGMKVAGASGSLIVYSPLLNEYEPADAEFDDQSNFSAIGIDCKDGDWTCVSPNVKWCGTVLEIASNVVGVHFIEPHFVNGNTNYEAGSEPIVILGMGQSNMVGNSASTTGSKTVEPGVYIWDGTSAVHGTEYNAAAFGTAPFNVGVAPWANNLLVHAANLLAVETGRDVYMILIADGGRKIECFLTPDTLAANGWTAVVNFTPYMYPDIRDACLAVPGRNSPFPDVILWQQGEANNADSQAEYEAKLRALLGDLRANGILYDGLTSVTAGGLVPVHAYYATHMAACQAVAATDSSFQYISSAGLPDTDGWHFTGEALVTLGTAHADAVSLDAAGAGSGPWADSVLIKNYATRTNHFTGSYFDNGLIHDYAGTLNIRGGHYVKNARVSLQHPYLRVYATSVGQTVASGFSVTDLGGKCSIGFLPNGANTWSGDWTTVYDQYSSMDNDNNTAQMRRTEYNLYSASVAKVEYNYKPTGPILKEWQVGPDKIQERYDATAGEVSYDCNLRAETLFGNVVTLGTVSIFKGAGTPEGSVTAPVGSMYMRTNGGAGTSLYIKESGVGNTGWVPK